MHKSWIATLDRVAYLTKAVKIIRWLHYPFKLTFGFLYTNVIYQLTGKGFSLRTTTFFGEKMVVNLPSGKDIYIFGAKNHSSEIRLAKFLIKNLDSGDTFVDVGAHFGYYSLLAGKLVGEEGNIHCFEPSLNSYSILMENLKPYQNITSNELVVSDTIGKIDFVEFPLLFSENNTSETSGFEDKEWFQKVEKRVNNIDTITLDTYCTDKKINPQMVKIDVEGGEYKVLSGFMNQLVDQSPVIVMECWDINENKDLHQHGIDLLTKFAYKGHIIDDAGNISPCEDLAAHYSSTGTTSDNIVFMKIID